jgi:hypothetical protein
MKLLKHDKEAMVNQIMKDVPAAITLTQVGDLYRKEMEAAHAAAVPPEVLKLAKSGDTKKYFQWTSQPLHYCLGHDRYGHSDRLEKLGTHREIHTHLASSHLSAEKVALGAAKMLRAFMDQEDQRDQLRRELLASLSDIKTSDALIKRFPEFEKYLPKEQAPVYLPATTNLIASLSKMGWPAGAVGAAA